MTQYKTKFTDLARFAPHLVENEARKAYKFEHGLRDGIRTTLSTLRDHGEGLQQLPEGERP